MNAVARLPFAENRVEPIDLPRRDPGVERFGNAVGELWDAEPNATAWRFSSEQRRLFRRPRRCPWFRSGTVRT